MSRAILILCAVSFHASLAEAALSVNAACKIADAPILQFDPPQPVTGVATWRKRVSAGNDLNLNEELVVRGRDAACIDLYLAGFILMRDGSVFKRRGDVLQRQAIVDSPFRSRPAQTGPVLNGRRPVSVTKLSWSADAKRRLAVWPAGSGSEIALFDIDAASNAKLVRLGTFRNRLRGITFFPSPDAPLGGVTVIHEIGSGHIRILSGILQYTS